MEHPKPIQLFLHIPKTAGTTLRLIVKRQFPGETLYEWLNPLGYKEENEMTKSIAQFSRQEKSKFRCFMGHMPFGLHEQLPEPHVYFTMLRDPVERTLSDYYYIMREPRHHPFCHNLMVTKGMSLREFLENESLGRSNVQTRYLAGEMDLINGTSRAVGKETFDKALKNFADIEIVGVAEKFDESLCLFKTLLGWGNIFYESAQITENRPKKDQVPAETLDLIRHHNRYDLELYDTAVKRFSLAMQKQGESFQKNVKAFQEENHRIGEILKRGREMQREAFYSPSPKLRVEKPPGYKMTLQVLFLKLAFLVPAFRFSRKPFEIDFGNSKTWGYKKLSLSRFLKLEIQPVFTLKESLAARFSR